MKAAVGTMIIIYEKGFGSMKELEKAIDRNFFEKNELKWEFDKLSWEQKRDKGSCKIYSNLY